MAGATSVLASAAVGSLLVVGTATGALAQGTPRPAASPAVRPASAAASGGIAGVVLDERGTPVQHVVVSALGAVTTLAVTDADGRFEFGTLVPGPYLLRAHLPGFVAPRAQVIEVSPSARTTSRIALRRERATPILAAGIGGEFGTQTAAPVPAAAPAGTAATAAPDDEENHTETAWRIRHGRRGILKDARLPDVLLAEADADADDDASILEQLAGTSGRVVSLFADAPISGQVNLLTSGSFDSPQQLFSTDTVARNIANVRLGAPAGERADWNVAGALTQADISSWVVSGAYSMRAPARHRYDLGMSYSTQRYDGGNPLALREVADGSRNVGTVYAYDSFAVTSSTTLAFGGEYARYDYLTGRSLLSPRLAVTLTPAARTRITGSVSRKALAPGAEEFLPPGDAGIWLPPQRTFSSLNPRAGLTAERTLATSVGLERDLGLSTLAVRTFRQRVSDQLVTVFGAEVHGQPAAKIGHYLVGNAGTLDTQGVSAEFRAVIASRVHGSVQYSVARGQFVQAGRDTLMVLAPLGASTERQTIQDVTARIQTDVPETSTRVLMIYRLSNGFARNVSPTSGIQRGIDSRFDVQIRQSLPFMNFSSARWEMLLAVRNFFRDAACDQSFYDELFVVRPPKRIVGGVTLHF